MFDKDYFALFSLKKSFVLDLELLEKNYLVLQKKYHPDLYIFDQMMQKVCFDYTNLINKAYKKIKNKITRAKYLLELENIDFAKKLKEILTSQDHLDFFKKQEEISSFLKNQQLKKKQENLTKEKNSLFLSLEQEFIKYPKKLTQEKVIKIIYQIEIIDKLIDQIAIKLKD